MATLDDELIGALRSALRGDVAVLVVDRFRASNLHRPYAVRAALARADRDEAHDAKLAWPARAAARAALVSIDSAIDRSLLKVHDAAFLDALARDITEAGTDDDRVRRSLAVAADRLSPPLARARARIVDLLRAHPLGAARASVYGYLVAVGGDVRGPLADDVVLDPRDRLAVMTAFASRIAREGRRRALAWRTARDASLVRMLADWTSYVAHPRVLLHHAGVPREAIADKPLPREVAWYVSDPGPDDVDAVALRAGSYECGRCGVELRATRCAAIDPDEPTRGAVLEFECPGCGLRYERVWNGAEVARFGIPRAVGA